MSDNARPAGECVLAERESRPRLLDLYCGAGGCSYGYALAGFEVIGVDIKPQPNYPFEFHQDDALEVLRDLPRSFHDLDAIHASPPCQAYSAMKVMHNAREHPSLVEPTRSLLEEIGLPWVMENVPGAPLDAGPPSLFSSTSGALLCGSMFYLDNGRYELRRHRLFESNIPLIQPQCRHRLPVVGFYGDHARIRSRVDGHKDRGRDIVGMDAKLDLVRDLMGIDWMTWTEANQAIPPRYTEFIGNQLIAHLECKCSAVCELSQVEHFDGRESTERGD